MTKSCKQCAQQFEITEDDLKFYDKVSPVIGGQKFSFPVLDLCPGCRQKERLVFRNERFLYHRKCDLCRHEIISTYSSDTTFPVYCTTCFWSDKWDSTSYARDFDFSKDFFSQFAQLLNETPHISLNAAQNENADYVNYAGNNKNCYLLFSGEYNEDVYYADHTIKSRNCIDTDQTFSSELVYDAINIENCYALKYSVNCKNCRDSLFLFDCIGCGDCILCSNLRNKKYYILNKAYSKEAYETEKKKFLEKISSFTGLNNAKTAFASLVRDAIHYSGRIINSQNSSGDHLLNTNNCRFCFNVTNSQDCAYVNDGFDVKDLYDVDASTEAELVFNGMSVGYNAYNVLFSHHVWWSNNINYSFLIKSCNNLFGCSAVANGSYQILNKPYSEKDYYSSVKKIILHMQKTGEWGRFFPVSLSPFGYNETLAQDFHPMTKDAVLEKNMKWKEKDEFHKYAGSKTKLPEKIAEINFDLTRDILTCECCGKNYRVVAQELEFYKKQSIPVPRYCFECRHRERAKFQNSHHLYNRNCSKCGDQIETTYSPERPEKVYCEKCYLKEVY